MKLLFFLWSHMFCYIVPAAAVATPFATKALLAIMGMQAAGSTFSAIGAGSSNDDNIKQRNKELLAQLAMQNKQLRENQRQFDSTMALKEKEMKEDDPSQIMNMMGMLGSLGKKPANTADTMGAFLGR